jgi:hypothetical protein
MMITEKNKFVRGHCQSCGAPIIKTKQKGKYLCQYCGTVYFDSSYTETGWEADKNDLEIEEDQFSSAAHKPGADGRKRQIITLGAVLCAVICLLIFMVNRSLRSPGNNYPDASEQIIKPQMLAALPAASQAGKSIPYNNWELSLDPQIEVNNNRIFLKLSLTNWSDDIQVLRYTPNDLVVYDDLGNTYSLFLGNCDIDLPHLDRQISIKPNEQVSIRSNTSWCNRAEYIPAFSGVIPLDANHLYLHLKEFGVFQNLTFIIDL